MNAFLTLAAKVGKKNLYMLTCCEEDVVSFKEQVQSGYAYSVDTTDCDPMVDKSCHTPICTFADNTETATCSISVNTTTLPTGSSCNNINIEQS